jgi:hypothetical protein
MKSRRDGDAASPAVLVLHRPELREQQLHRTLQVAEILRSGEIGEMPAAAHQQSTFVIAAEI